ncbi:MAG: bacillithiol biosynthesis cysteine-adding enzyme BshC [Bacteroidota bacterium]
MDCTSTSIPYRQTNYFTPVVLDYIEQSQKLTLFFANPPGIDGIKKAIETRKKFPTDRALLVRELKSQYTGAATQEAVEKSIESLLSENTFAITTAHQPNIFTGPLYFLYKILHTIKLAEHLTKVLPGNNFVPVYYMGSEDADLDELGNTALDGQKLEWETKQTGAVGRMLVDKELLKLIAIIEGQLLTEPFGKEIVSLIKQCYKAGDTIQAATFRIVHALFGKYGLVVLIPDNAALKSKMIEVFKDDLLHQKPSMIVEETSKQLESVYKVQANPREINLFYLKNNIRNRIEERNDRYEVLNTVISFSKEELIAELTNHPECFSPNVILRGMYQETILPGIVFIGGGGELAYWLQLKGLFNHYKVPYPVLLLRNSFLVVENRWQEKLNKLHFNVEDFFLSEEELLKKLVERDTKNSVKLNGALVEVEQLYETFKKQACAIDETLAPHVDALKARSIQSLQELEKKMLRAEKRKFADQQRQIQVIKEKLFPGNSLQERTDNFSYFYAKWGSGFIDKLYENSLTLEGEFVVLSETV